MSEALTAQEREARGLGVWVESLWTTPCPHGGGYARDCTRCIHETLYRSDWLAAHVERIVADRLAAVEALADRWEQAPGDFPLAAYVYASQLRAAVAADPADTGPIGAA
jgi:hypothetical protein